MSSPDPATPTPSRRDEVAGAGALSGSAFAAERATFPVTPPDYGNKPGAIAKPVTAGAKSRRRLAMGLAFLAPNIFGFMAFTAVPLLISMVMAFTNWDLKLHNRIRDAELAALHQPPETIRWVGFDNFVRLFQQDDFWRYLGNTLFFMMGMPFSIGASLLVAIMLSKDLRGGSRRVWAGMIAGAVLIGSTLMLYLAGAGGTGMTLLFGGLASGVVIAGVIGGSTVYRTLFYVPHFTAGVATFLLWKKLYNPTSGPITHALTGPLNSLTQTVVGMPVTFWHLVCVGILAVVLGVFAWSVHRLRLVWIDGDLGWAAAMASLALLLLPAVLALRWLAWLHPAAVPPLNAGVFLLLAAGLVIVWNVVNAARADRAFRTIASTGFGTGFMFAAAIMVAEMVLIGFATVAWQLPQWAAVPAGLTTPNWLTDVSWAKPSIMVMGFWGAIGSNTMLLYLAALTNVPQELYEASDVDGAGPFTKFWNITWPQLAPTTFFIVVMGVIGGLQGGFEMARVMTQGGPAGETTTLSYFVYTEGFETGRLGFSSAVAWTLFLMVLLVTLFNWKFGNKYVND